VLKGAFVSSNSIKEDALRLVQQLPANATWEDLQYEIYVRQAIEAGLRDSREGRTVPAHDVRRQFDLDRR
jgi:predicted transcriptional regulator